MKTGTIVAGVVVALGLAGGAWYAYSRAGATAEAGERVFATPERRTMAASVLATGVLRLRVGGEVRVGAQLSGIVEKLNVEVGSKIRKGDIIAEIDASGLEARLAQARAQVAVEEQGVRRAEVELSRARQLDERKLVARSQVEDAQIALDEARAMLVKARRDMEVVQTDLSYAVIRSPITGTVASVATQEGETVAASFNTPTFATVIEDGALELIAMVDETDIGNVAVGNPVMFTVEAYPSREFEGRVARIAPKGSIISGVVNFEVMIRIDSPAELLKPDMTANVSIRTAEREALVVPNASVQREGSERYVWVEQGGELVRKAVSIGTRDASFTEIRQGLGPTDRVLVSPQPQSGAAGQAGSS
ncbi:Macrolide export protein MacA [Gammaproteobacteria bacterium]|nr:efflux RND transporter periplasmic adaptor subunit [Gammaproteobacteria bacterium]CAG0939863.1 Macrolide export protein MacA [Gammaproteobacteria bacterium]